MSEYRRGNHTISRLTVHLVWVTKYRYHVLKGDIQKRCRELIIQICDAEDGRILKGVVSKDHVHMLISIPPKYSVSQVVGFLKGKSAITIARNYSGGRRNFVGQKFWARGYYVSTVGHDESIVRCYIQRQEVEEQRIEQLRLSDEW